MLAPSPSRARAVADEALARAESAVREHPNCFWTRRPGTRIESVDDIRLVIRRLRQNGNRAAWHAARGIETCL
jgi:hypothetical protein